MAKSHLFGIMFSLILMGCDAQKPFSAAADSSESTTALAGVSINIKDDGIYFSDTKVQLGGTLEMSACKMFDGLMVTISDGQSDALPRRDRS
ncbi:hypothetical protein [Massilia sp. TWP1-3-3]|uniref:hypothetical protein n=1 Tax=Massilia sp. TWP1-3-3 TaxID=2804573 RepID=UPI003CFBB0C9